MYRYKLFIKRHWFEIAVIIFGIIILIIAINQYIDAFNQLNEIKRSM